MRLSGIRWLSITSVALGVGALAFWEGNHLFSQALVSRRLSVIPFTAQIEEKNVPPPGATSSTIRLTDMLYARKSNRSFVHTISAIAPDGNDGTIREIIDTVSNTITVLEPSTRSEIIYVYTPDSLEKLLNTMDSENCEAAEPINGVPADAELSAKYGHSVKHVARRIAAQDKVINIAEESWRVPELNCFAVKEIAKRSDGAEIIRDVTFLTEGPPSDDLFTIPADYTERSPLTVEHLYEGKFHRAFWGESIAAGLEKKYFTLRAMVPKN